jgi:hypothetical protein
VVQDLLQKHPKRFIRRGFLAWTMMVLNLLMPTWLIDRMFTKVARLADLKTMLQSEEDKKQQ